jgi:hypothetical protein
MQVCHLFSWKLGEKNILVDTGNLRKFETKLPHLISLYQFKQLQVLAVLLSDCSDQVGACTAPHTTRVVWASPIRSWAFVPLGNFVSI